MLNLSVIGEHSLENSLYQNMALINDGGRPYIRKSEGRCQRTEVRGQRTEDGRQRTEDGYQKSEN